MQQATYAYNAQGQEYRTSQDIDVPDNCNGLTFINRGDGVIFVNDIPLSPNPTAGLAGESIAIGGNVGELYYGKCKIVFAPGATLQSCIVVFKYYVDPKFA